MKIQSSLQLFSPIRAFYGFFILFSLVVLPAVATNYTWTGSSSKDWYTSGNWSPSGVPGGGDNVIIGSGSDTIQISGNITIANLTISGRKLNLAGYTLTSTGTSALSGGKVYNGNLLFSGSQVTFSSTADIASKVNITSPKPYFNGGTFADSVVVNSILASSSTLSSGGTTFNGPLIVTVSGSTYTFRMEGSSRNIYNAPVTFTVGGRITFQFSNTSGTNTVFSDTLKLFAKDTAYIQQNGASGTSTTFSKRVIVTCQDTAQIIFGVVSGQTTTFNDDLDISASSKRRVYIAHSGSVVFYDNVILSCISGAGIYFGYNTTASLTHSSGALQVGTGGFSGGRLDLYRYSKTSSDSTALTFTGTSKMIFGINNSFSGPVRVVSPMMYLNGTTFNSYARLDQNGTTNTSSTGGNTFNGETVIGEYGTGQFQLCTSASATDNFNGKTVFKNYASYDFSDAGNLVISKDGTSNFSGSKTEIFLNTASRIILGYNEGSVVNMNTNLELNSISDGWVYLGGRASKFNLGAGKTIKVGSSGFSGGRVCFYNVEQVDTTSINLTFTGSGSRLSFIKQSYSPFGTTKLKGKLNYSGPVIDMEEADFFGDVTISITGGANTNSYSNGGNNFYGNLSFENNSGYTARLAYLKGDVYHKNVFLNKVGSGNIQVAYIGESIFKGNISTNGGVLFGTNGGWVKLDSSATQTIDFLAGGSGVPSFKKLKIQKTGGQVQVNLNGIVTDSLNLVNGIIKMGNSNYLDLKAGLICSGASNVSYVDGQVRKTGNTAFSFPIGSENKYFPLSISAPSNSTDAFTAKYFSSSANPLYSFASKDGTLNNLDEKGYWTLDRNVGTSTPNVTLGFGSNYCGTGTPSSLKVANWNGSTWKDRGNSSTTSTSITVNTQSGFGPFLVSNLINSATANAGSDVSVCSGSSVSLSGSGTGIGSLSYSWDPSTGLSSTTVSNPSANPTATRTYYLKVTDSYGCKASDTLVVMVNPLPTANAGSDVAFCTGSSIGLSASASGGTPSYTYAWSPSTGLSSTSVSNPTASPASTTTYTVTVTDSKGCSANDAVVVTVNALPVADAGRDTTIYAGDTVQIGASALMGKSYNWSPTTTISNPFISNPETYSIESVIYQLTVLDSINGCINVDSISIEILGGNCDNGIDLGSGDTILRDFQKNLDVVWFTFYPDSESQVINCYLKNLGEFVLSLYSNCDSLLLTDTLSGNVYDSTLTLNPEGLILSNLYQIKIEQLGEARNTQLTLSIKGRKSMQNCEYECKILPNEGFSIFDIDGASGDDIGGPDYLCGWETAYGSPQVYTEPGVGNCVYMWGGGYDGVHYFGEGIKTTNFISLNGHYYLKYKIRIAPASASNSMDKIYFTFGNIPIISNSILPSTPPGVVLDQLNNLSGSNWITRTTCFDLNSNGQFCIYPIKQSEDIAAIEIDDIQIFSVPGKMKIPEILNCNITSTEIGPECLPDGATISWESDPTLSCLNCQNPVATPQQSTTYHYTITLPSVSDDCICECPETYNGSVFVQVKKLAIEAFHYDAVCKGVQDGQLGVSILNGTPNYSYSWLPTTNLSNPNISNPTVNSFSGSQTYTVTVTDQGGCMVGSSTTISYIPCCVAQSGEGDCTGSNNNFTFNGQTSFGTAGHLVTSTGNVTSGYEIGSQTFIINGIFIVDANLTIKNCEVKMGPMAQIIVLPGRSLTLNYSTWIHAGCDYMWKNILIGNNSSFITSGNTGTVVIEDALISVLNYGVWGAGNFDIDNTIFNKNLIGVYVFNNPLQSDLGTITNSQFLCHNHSILDNSIPSDIFSAISGSGISSFTPTYSNSDFDLLLNPLSNEVGSIGIKVENQGNTDFTIGGNNFFENIHIGISEYQSNLKIQDCVIKDMVTQSAPAIPWPGYLQDEAGYGVKGISNTNSLLKLEVDNTLFIGSKAGVGVAGKLEASIHDSYFKDQTNFGIRGALFGLTDQKVDINNNTIQGAPTGIQSITLFDGKFIVHDNYIVGNTSSPNTIGISSLLFSGRHSTFASNSISNTTIGIKSESQCLNTFFNNQINNLHGSGWFSSSTGIWLSNSSYNLLQKNEAQYSTASPSFLDFGLRTDISTNNWMLCNNFHNQGMGILSTGLNVPTTLFSNILFENNITDLLMFNCGNVGNIGGATPGNTYAWDNTFSNGSVTPFLTDIYSLNTNSNQYNVVYQNNSSFIPTVNSGGINSSSIAVITPPDNHLPNLFCNSVPNPEYYYSSPIQPTLEDRIISALSILTDSSAQPIYDLSYKWMQKFNLFNMLFNDDSLRNSDTRFQDFYSENVNTNLAKIVRALDQFNDIEGNLGSGNMAEYTDSLSKMKPINSCEARFKDIGILLINYFNGKQFEEDPNESSSIELLNYWNDTLSSITNHGRLKPFSLLEFSILDEIAKKCPYSDGPAVLLARSLIGMFSGNPFAYMNSCEFLPEPSFKLENFENDTVVSSSTIQNIIIYPNPATDKLNIKLSGFETIDANLIMRNIQGQEVFRLKVKTDGVSLPLTLLKGGLYLININNCDGYSFNQKIIIEK